MIKELFRNSYKQYGKEVSAYVMDNGEYRFRLSSDDSSYIRTEAEGEFWQKSHFHTLQTEYYVVEKGNVLCAIVENAQVVIKKYKEGESFFVLNMVPHNIRISKGGIVHTVKFGGKTDWISFPKLDEFLKLRK